MRIRVAILDLDRNYLNRIVSVFNGKYSDNLVTYSFTDEQTALAQLVANKIDVFLATDQFDIDVKSLPQRCGFAYLVESNDISSVREQSAIGKFQKADLIYRQILSVYSEQATAISGLSLSGGKSRIVMFTSPAGGTGVSSVAAAYATMLAKKGRRALYLDLSVFGNSDTFFKAEGQFDMGDIIYALKSKKANVTLKIESCVKQDSSGVCFFSASKVALDMMELTAEDIRLLLQNIQLMDAFDVIVVDMPFDLSKESLQVYEKMEQIVLIGNGTAVSNEKITRAYEAMKILEGTTNWSLLEKTGIIYNNFSSHNACTLEIPDLHEFGGAPHYGNATEKQVVDQLAGLPIFDEITV